MSYYYEVTSYTDGYTSSREGYRNSPPYHPSYYRKEEARRIRGNYVDVRNSNAKVDVTSVKSDINTQVTNKLYKKFVGKLGDKSSFGATLTAELNSTIGTVGGLALRLAKAAYYVKKLKLADAARELGIPYRERTIITGTRGFDIVDGRATKVRKSNRRRTRTFFLPSGREVQKTLANGWLMYSYGLKPIIQDIYTAVDTLQRPFEYKQKIRVTASDTGKFQYDDLDPSHFFSTETRVAKVQGSCGATVSVINPNYRLASQLGLTNPLQWLNEAIPFSFVADWFSNLSDVINKFSDFDGLQLEDSWQCMLYQFERGRVDFNPFKHPYPQDSYHKCYVFERSVSLPSPVLTFAYERFQPQRALNAVSLLVGFLPRR